MKTFQIHFAHGAVIEKTADVFEFDGRTLLFASASGISRMRDNDIISCHEKNSTPRFIEHLPVIGYVLYDAKNKMIGICRNEYALKQLHDAAGPRKPVVKR